MVYAPLLATGMALMFARLLVMAKLLDIDEFALLSAALIVSNLVATFACFGLFLHLQRTLPVLMARSRFRAGAVQLAQTSLAAVAIGVAGLVVALLVPPIGGITPGMIALGAVHGTAQQFFLIATTESRSNNEPVRYSVQHLIRSAATLGLAIPAAIYIGTAESVLFAETIVAVVAVTSIMLSRHWHLRGSAVTAVAMGLRSLRKVEWGSMLSLLTYSLVSAVGVQLDRWLSSVALPQSAFAHYAFAWIVMIAALSVQALVNASTYPVIARRHALLGPAVAFRFAAALSGGMLAMSLLLVAPATYLTGLLVRSYLPAYADAVDLLPLLAVAGALRVSDFWSTLIIVAGRERIMLGATVVAILASLAVWLLIAGLGPYTAADFALLALLTSVSTYAASVLLCLPLRKAQSIQ